MERFYWEDWFQYKQQTPLLAYNIHHVSLNMQVSIIIALLFNCFPFERTNLLVWLNPFLVNITHFFPFNFKDFMTLFSTILNCAFITDV